jgi:hypothetical protein
VEKEPTNPRDSMFPNHVFSLDILRTKSPNSWPDFLADAPGIVRKISGPSVAVLSLK